MGNDAKRGLLCPEGPGQVEGKSSVSTGDPCLQQKDRAHKTWHMGTSATDYRPPPVKGPSPGWPWAPLCLSGSKPAPQFEAGRSHLRVRAWTHAGVRTLKRCQSLPQGSSPFSGLSHGALGSPTLAPPGLLITAGEVLAASSSRRTGGRDRAAPTPAVQPPLPVPRK